MDIVIRATVMFAVVFGLLRLMGKRELGQLTPFDVVLLVVMGDLIQQGVTHNDFSLTGAVLAVVTIAFWTLVLSLVSFRFPSAERVLDGQPAVVVRDGALLEKNLAHNRMTRAEIESELRLAGISRLSDVAWGILEPDGKISFIRKDPNKGEPARAAESDLLA